MSDGVQKAIMFPYLSLEVITRFKTSIFLLLGFFTEWPASACFFIASVAACSLVISLMKANNE